MRRYGITILLAVCILALVIGPLGAPRPLQAAEGGQAGELKQDVAAMSVAGIKTGSTNVLPEGMGLIAETDELRLYADSSTAEVAVEHIGSGEVWHSNPPGRHEDEHASPLFKSLLSSQFTLNYYTETGQLKTLNSYDDSVKRGQFVIEPIAGGVKTIYTVGNKIKGLDVIPKAISKERFETAILEKIEDEELRMRVKLRFDFDAEKEIYTPRKMQNFVVEETAAALESAGYTSEEAEKDNKENGIEAEGEQGIQFVVAVEYRLEGDRFIVSVPTDELVYDKRFPIQTIHLLEYFGAAGNADEGYLFVPDGTGALIHFNNGKLTSSPYDAPVYGLDEAVQRKEVVQRNETIRFPVFGMVRGESAFLAVIEEGDALSSVKADISGRYHSFNSVSAKFELVKMDYITLTSGSRTSSIPVFQSGSYGGELRISFQFLQGNDASYSGIAALYRDRLALEGQWQRQEMKRDLPFILQLEGAFEKRKSFLGIPYKSTVALTTFEEAIDIISQLKEQGISHIQLRYEGWSDKGIRHGAPAKLSPESKLGGKGGLQRLTEYLRSEGVAFYPDIAFQQKFRGDSGAATFLNQKDAKIFAYSPVHFMEDKSKFSHYVLSPAALPGAVEGAKKKISKLDIEGLSLRDLGAVLSGDYHDSKSVDRQKAKELVQSNLNSIASGVGRLMVNGGNGYALDNASTVVNAPLRSSSFNILDEDVPFYQMVLHGYIDYAGQPWNMAEAQNIEWQALKALETGSSVYFQWFHSDPSVIKGTDYDYLYSAHYLDWLELANEQYQSINAVLKQVQGQTISSHKKLQADVYETTYENGLRIVVNYSDDAVQINGAAIPPNSYWAGGE